MTFFRLRGHPRLALAAALLALATLVPIASAQDEPAFVFPCADGVEWAAEPGQPISFFCGWGTQGGPGLMTTFLKAHRATLIVLDEGGDAGSEHRPRRVRDAVGRTRVGSLRLRGRHVRRTDRPGRWLVLSDRRRPAGRHVHRHPHESLRHPVTDGFHTCRFDDGTRLTHRRAFETARSKRSAPSSSN